MAQRESFETRWKHLAVLVLVVVAETGAAVSYFSNMTYGQLYVTPDSMSPTITTGDIILVQPVTSNTTYHVGEIIVFEPYPYNNSFKVCHRIVNLTDWGTVTKGDANAEVDQEGGWLPYVTPNMVVGIVCTVCNFSGSPEVPGILLHD